MKKIVIKNILFVISVFFPSLSFCLNKEELIKKINAYTIQIINKELPSWKTNPQTGKPVYDLSALKNNTRIFLFEPMLLSIRKYINEGSQQPSEEPVLNLSKELLNLVTSRINSAGTPLDVDLNKANDVIDKLQYADMNTDNFDKQEVLEYLRKNIVEIANYVFSLNIPASAAESYMILKDDIKSVKSDIDDLEDFFIKNKNNILMEEFSDEAKSNWSYIIPKIKNIITDSNSNLLPNYLNDLEKLGNKIFESLNKLSKNPKNKALLDSLNSISNDLSSNINAIKNLKIVSLSKTNARDALIYLASKLISIIKVIESPETVRMASKGEAPIVNFEQINNDLNNYLIKLKQVPSLKIKSILDQRRAIQAITNLKRTSLEAFTKLMLFLSNHKELEETAEKLNELNHKLLENFEKHYSLRTIKKELIIKDKIKLNYEKRLNIIKELDKLNKELEILKNTNNISQKNKIISLFLTSSSMLLDIINEFNKNYPITLE